MGNKILLCSDLDRTILPNGNQEESPQARPLLRALSDKLEVTLAYVSGRHKELLLEAIQEYNIPIPNYAIGDVGTTIYEVNGEQWNLWEAWHQQIAPDWQGKTADSLAGLFDDIEELQLQEPEKQNLYKLSYYTPEKINKNSLFHDMQNRLNEKDLQASLIWSIDEMAHVGLLDVLPQSANKLHAIRFLMKEKGFDEQHTVFAGDSGNDLDVMTSGLQSVLVANASDHVRNEVVHKSTPDKLYCARGDFLGMNGNYSAGVLEGFAHFIPQAKNWLSSISL